MDKVKEAVIEQLRSFGWAQLIARGSGTPINIYMWADAMLRSIEEASIKEQEDYYAREAELTLINQMENNND